MSTLLRYAAMRLERGGVKICRIWAPWFALADLTSQDLSETISTISIISGRLCSSSLGLHHQPCRLSRSPRSGAEAVQMSLRALAAQTHSNGHAEPRLWDIKLELSYKVATRPRHSLHQFAQPLARQPSAPKMGLWRLKMISWTSTP